MRSAGPHLSVRQRAILGTAALIVFLTALVIVVVSCMPVITHAELQTSSEGWRTFQMPFVEYHPANLETKAKVTLFVHERFMPDTFILRYSDEITSFQVNGTELAPTLSGSFLHLAQYLHPGDNDIRATILVTTDPMVVVFGLDPSIWNPLVMTGITLTMLAFFLWLAFLRRIGAIVLPNSVFWIVLIGIGIRVLYAFSTPAYVRAYDWGGHLQYILYLVDRFEFPHVGELWQGHQPPLFYLIETPFAFLARGLGWNNPEIAQVLRLVPMVLSVGTLLIGVRILMTFCTRTSSRIVGTLLIAVFPALIFLSSQVSNDALLTFVGFLWFESLVRSVRSGSRRSWAYTGLLCGIGLLTKANALPWIVVSAFMASLSHKHTMDRLRDVGVIGFVAFIGGGWWYVVQTVFRQNFSVVANAFSQVGLVKLQPVLSEFLTFNPLEIIHHPSVSVADPLTRPQFLLETLFRSSQLGSNYFSNEVNILLVLAMFLLIWILVGAYAEYRKGNVLCTATILLLLLASALFRLKYPFATAQHFRYIVVTVVPLTVLAVRGIESVRSQFLRILGEMTAGIYALFVLIIFLSVGFYS